MRRTKSYNEEVSERLKKPSYAREFICSLMEDPEYLSVEDALRHTIQVMGYKEFSEITGYPVPNLVAFVKRRRNLKADSLDQLLKPFKLKTKLVLERAG